MIYEMDGTAFRNYDEFAAYFSNRVLREHRWNGNLNAFNDILRGGFGTPEEGFTLRVVNTDAARRALGYSETVRLIETALKVADPSRRAELERQLADAQRGIGQTMF